MFSDMASNVFTDLMADQALTRQPGRHEAAQHVMCWREPPWPRDD
jgi:hypothetical protein